MNDRYRQGAAVGWGTMAGNAGLTILKAAVGFTSGSSALVADAVHSGSDVLSTAVAMLGLRVSSAPPDEGHPYGHGRAESIASKLLALSLMAVGAGILWQALGKLAEPAAVAAPGQAALWVAGLSVLGKELMYRWSCRVGRRINSPALIADGWHHRSDALSSVAALIGVAGARSGRPWLDPAAAAVVAVMVAYVGWAIFAQSLRQLMDERPSAGLVNSLREGAAGIPGVEGIDSLNVRQYGPSLIVDVEVGIDAEASVAEGHAIADRVREGLMSSRPDVLDVMVHVNPASSGSSKRVGDQPD